MSAADNVSGPEEFQALLGRISRGEAVAQAELIPYLTREDHVRRRWVNLRLAQAFAQIDTPERSRQAFTHMHRAWVLSGFAADLLPGYLTMAAAAARGVGEARASNREGDGVRAGVPSAWPPDDLRDGGASEIAAAARDACKRVGLRAVAQGRGSDALARFDEWQNAYAVFARQDRYEFDFDILDAIERLAAPHRRPHPPAAPTSGRRIRVAYLLKGLSSVGSVLTKISLSFAQWHDRSRFEITCFATETDADVATGHAQEYLREFAAAGCRVVCAPDLPDTVDRLLALARRIQDTEPDLLVASAALADFQSYFLTALRPAPVMLGLVHGPPAQFAPPTLDWGIAWTKAPLIDTPIDCTLVDLETVLPERKGLRPRDRLELDLPANACVLMSAGRPVKFQDPGYWNSVLTLLRAHPGACYVVLGASRDQIPHLASLPDDPVAARLRFVRWTDEADYLRTLCLADIVLDTFPSGGGVTLIDSMSLGVPVVSFEHDYSRLFDQRNWSVGAEGLGQPELIAPRGDFVAWRAIVVRLIDDPAYRREMGARGQAHVRDTRGNPERMVRRCEAVYSRVLEARQIEQPALSR